MTDTASVWSGPKTAGTWLFVVAGIVMFPRLEHEQLSGLLKMRTARSAKSGPIAKGEASGQRRICKLARSIARSEAVWRKPWIVHHGSVRFVDYRAGIEVRSANRFEHEGRPATGWRTHRILRIATT